MEKRLIFVFVVSTLVAVVWLSVVNYRHGQEELGAARAQEAAEAAAPAEEAPTAAEPAPGAAAANAQPVQKIATAEGAAENTVKLVNAPYFEAAVSELNATFRTFELLDPQYAQQEKPAYEGVPQEKVEAGPLDLVSTWSPEFYPFEIDWTRLEGTPEADALREAWTKTPRFTLVEQTDDSLTWVWPDPKTWDGALFVEKRYVVEGPYDVGLAITIYNLGAKDVTAQLVMNIHGWQRPDADEGGMFSPRPDLLAGSCMAGDEVEREEYHALLDEKLALTGQVKWAAVDTRYFMLAVLPRNLANSQCSLDAAPVGVVTARIHQTQPAIAGGSALTCLPDWVDRAGIPKCTSLLDKLGAKADMSPKQLADAYAEQVGKQPAAETELKEAYDRLRSRGGLRYEFGLYAGPKDIELLDQAGQELREALDFGILSFLSIPMLYILRVAHDFVPSWALAIVILTVLVKLILLPLTHKSFAQMQRMQKLKPEMDKLREQLGSDKQKLNQAMLQLYKTHKVNPLGGCLPMLLQMPVYIALYQTIYHSVELYQAPLFGWVTDLSAPDPYFVLPVILGVTMYVQQLITPTSMDSAQARMMKYIMPVMFTGFMLFLPSGLVLYIFVNTILSLIQQYALQRKMA
jgi:YidC/Oxa1 family membrane protein insertase